MKTGAKLLAGAGTIAAIVALGPVGAADGRGQANTKVTIQGGGGLVSGLVKSPDENNCADDRKVLIYQVKNGNADKVASDRATQDGDDYQWAKGFDGGRYFAKVKPNNQCEGDETKTVSAGQL